MSIDCKTCLIPNRQSARNFQELENKKRRDSVVQLIAVLSRRFDVRSSYKLLKFSLSLSLSLIFFDTIYVVLLPTNSYRPTSTTYRKRNTEVPLAIRDCHRFSSCVTRIFAQFVA